MFYTSQSLPVLCGSFLVLNKSNEKADLYIIYEFNVDWDTHYTYELYKSDPSSFNYPE